MISKFFTVLLILAVLFISPNLITLANNPNSDLNTNSKLTQINIINFENSIGIAQVDRYLQENKLTSLKSVSLLSKIQVGNYILSLPLEYDVNVDNSPTKNVEKYKTIKINLIKELEKAKITNKEGKQNPNQTKFNRNDILKIIKKPDNKKEEIQNNKNFESELLPESLKVNELELIFFEENGYLPPIEVNEQEIKNKIKELNLPENQPIPHLDPIQKTKFTNSKLEEKQKILTNEEKIHLQIKINEQKIQEELVNEISTKDLENTNNNDKIEIIQLTYYTKNGDKSLKDLSKKTSKKIQKEENKENISKIKKVKTNEIDSQKTQKSKLQNKLEDNIKSIISRDISSIFVTDQTNEIKIKNQNEIEKQDYIQRAKNTKQGHNKKEVEMMQKSGINIKDFDIKITGEEIKVGILDDILNFGSVETSAKGLNNAKYGLLIYANQNTGLSLNADTPNNWQQLNLRTTQGYTGKQRWCFDNNSNKIYLDTAGICNGWSGKKCIHALGGSNYGGSIGLYDCNYNYGNDAGQQWIFDEYGRLALKIRPDLCMENASGLTNGNSMVIWGCQTGEFFRNQDYRAGYNNFGAPTGMTLWTTYVGNNLSSFTNGHTYIETWTYWGTENTFGKWQRADISLDQCNVWSDNDICDGDDNHVDNKWERQHRLNYLINGVNYWRRSTSSLLSKSDFDYISFGSGYRSNYKYNGVKMDLGGNGTYDWWGNTKSRDTDYKSTYGILGTNYCSSYALAFWRNFRDNQSPSSLNPNWIITPTDIYNAL